jgi:hypothetical protein
MGSAAVIAVMAFIACSVASGTGCRDRTPATCPPCASSTPQPGKPLDAGVPIHDASTVEPSELPNLENFLPERFFPGPDTQRGERKRRTNVVILFAPPGPIMPEAGLASVEKLRLQPIVCVLFGKLAFGARCGEAMPSKTTVRLTETGSSGFEELEVERATAPYHDRQGGHVFPAPYGPACCMYNTCVGKTLPYFAKSADPHFTLTTTKTVLAIWPADAELDMTLLGPGPTEDVSVDKPPWTSLPCGKRASCLVQALQVGERRYASIRNGLSGTALFADLGKGFVRLEGEHGAREFYVLATTDLDRDGRPELLVYAHWANDYGLHLYANDSLSSVYGYSCGNI